jgi:signal transduction histidine kinase
MNFAYRISSIGIYALIALLSESIFAFIFSSVLNISDKLFLEYGILFTLIIKLALVLTINIFFKRQIFQKIQLSKSIIILAPFLSVFLLICYMLFTYVIDYQNSTLIFSMIFIFQILFLNFSMFVLYNKMKMEKEKELEYQKIQQNLEKQKEQLNNAIVSQNQLQSIRHDLKNSVLVLASYIEEKKYSKALKFITTIQEEISDVERKILESYTPNKELNYLLLHKIGYAKAQGISTHVECLVPEYLVIDNEILIAIIGNLLDNAIHACMALSKETFPQIFLKLKYYDESLFIDIKNSVQKNFDLAKVKEGIGIKNIKQSVEKNSGIYRQILEEDKYCVQIILWDYKGENENE